jgi:hypothetical protein
MSSPVRSAEGKVLGRPQAVLDRSKLAKQDERSVPKVIDFGAARAIDPRKVVDRAGDLFHGLQGGLTTILGQVTKDGHSGNCSRRGIENDAHSRFGNLLGCPIAAAVETPCDLN